ncbi:Proton myo-inositol cotransporter [Phytophthora fragariae]|uniref:Hexose transporter 1 n=1 Tax=Phytophthora fragariae TaxID=53985 RepID=A0A6A4EST4_9STRA|nr:Proton myo-inositol cotransporter [Phytophthora fragariae]KAE8949504.1 Proton myo-inositol cotransporter [Phytophthora fragariae]KAE9027849.1 Proton myo-inositol cotransporter [Phytophthora fragariae]KAE9136222.1 Proton myo-inositol cotransporter [Phytophthora fragariae]KAE9139173.1 Proton myo-inositol cotransporter [Phytophthora fragariae]
MVESELTPTRSPQPEQAPPPSPSPTAAQPSHPHATSSPFLYLLTLCASIGGFLFGYDTGVISGALVLLKSPQGFALSDLQSEAVVAAAVGGAIAGAALSGIGNHKFGRRRVILFSSALFAVGAGVMAVAGTFGELLVGRLIVGVGIGCASMTVPLYIAEASPPQIRGRLVSLNSALITGGQFFASVLDALLADTEGGWRFMLGLAAIPAVLQFVGFLALPESPRYLVSMGKDDEARAALLKIRGDQDVDVELKHIKAEVQGSKLDESNVWEELRSPPVIRALTLGCFLQCLQQLCGINTVMYYGATIIQMAGFTDPSTAIWLSALVSFSNFIFTFVGIYLVERAGRRILTLGSLAGVFFSLVLLGGSFYVAEKESVEVKGTGACGGISTCFDCVANAACGFCSSVGGDLCMSGSLGSSSRGFCSGPQWSFDSCPDDNHEIGWAILMAMFLYLAFFASGMGCMPWTINAEIYPLRVRSFALSASTSVNWLSNLLVSFTFLSTIDALAPYGAFWLYAVVSLFGLMYLWLELPETKGLELEEIQRIFASRVKYSAVIGTSTKNAHIQEAIHVDSN